jgi:hypothetical protein
MIFRARSNRFGRLSEIFLHSMPVAAFDADGFSQIAPVGRSDSKSRRLDRSERSVGQ